MTAQANTDAICCPEFDPTKWDDRILEWTGKRFVKDHVCTLFYMPLNFGKVMTRLVEKANAAGAQMPDSICLSDHTSKWNMDLYLETDREIPNSENTTLSGRYYCKVYEGPFKDTGKWCADFETTAKAKGYAPKRLLMWYTTCPKCAKKYGKNYVAILGEVE